MNAATTRFSIDAALLKSPDVTLLVSHVVESARKLTMDALDRGWSGPPFDPFQLAELFGMKVIPSQDVIDARVTQRDGRYVINYNPAKAIARQRFSIAHEIAHTLFSDCADQPRNRATVDAADAPLRRLEMLCNLAAAELLMPIGSLGTEDIQEIGIDRAMTLRSKFQVSSEAMLMRIVRMSDAPAAMFLATRDEKSPAEGRYRLDYIIPGRSWRASIRVGSMLPSGTVVSECTAIGHTAKGREQWSRGEEFRVECVGVAPYPGRRYPRVVGVLIAPRAGEPSSQIEYLKGDATHPRGSSGRMVVHVVNDRATRWGGGFAAALRARCPDAHDDFQHWVTHHRSELRLGAVRFCPTDRGFVVASLVAQSGYGPSPTPRIRYAAMERALSKVAEKAAGTGISVHMPRIGCGQAGGDWKLVGRIVEDILVNRNISVFVYDPPDATPPKSSEELFD